MSEKKSASAFPWATALIAVLVLAAAAWPQGEALLAFERDRVAAGQWWRLLTAHFVHSGATHLILNLVVFVSAGGWLERAVPGRARLYYLLAPPLIGTLLYLLDSTLQRYSGLSGIVAGTIVLHALTQLATAEKDRWFWRALIAVVGLMIGVEFVAEGRLLGHFAGAGVHAVPLAHLVGIALAVAIHPRRWRRQTPST